MTEKLRTAIKAHGAHVDSAVVRFSLELAAVVAFAQTNLMNWLMTHLKLDADHKVLPTLANQQILRKIPELWQRELEDAGLSSIIKRYTDAYPQQIESFRTILEATVQEANRQLPQPKYSKGDHRIFAALIIAVAADLKNQMDQATQGIVTRTALVGGGLKFANLTAQIQAAGNVAKARTQTLADTSMQTFFRHVGSVAYEKIQARVGGSIKLRFFYRNPRDKVTRQWCLDMLDRAESLTKEQIQNLPPGPGGLDPWLFGGGWNCRGSFILDVADFINQIRNVKKK